jgi:hypothetical protein
LPLDPAALIPPQDILLLRLGEVCAWLGRDVDVVRFPAAGASLHPEDGSRHRPAFRAYTEQTLAHLGGGLDEAAVQLSSEVLAQRFEMQLGVPWSALSL